MFEAFTPENLEISPNFSVIFPPITETQPTLVPYAAYDIGSGGTKFMGALVNPQTLKIEEVFSQGSMPVSYQADLNQSPNHEFSDIIKELGLTALEKAKNQIEQDYQVKAHFQQYGTLKHFGVATAAFRSAENGLAVAEYFTEKLAIPIDIISQDQEGTLAYYGAVSKIDINAFSEKPIVWDIGGGSMQFTYKDVNESFHILKAQLASETFHTLVATKFSNQMKENEVAEAIDMAKTHLALNPEIKAFMADKIKNNTPVIAVGSVHNLSVQPLCSLAGMHVESNYYTKNDLQQAIQLLTDKTEAEIGQVSNISNPYLISRQLTNLILVYALTDTMHIEKVNTIKSSNIEGLLTLPQFGVLN